MGSSFLLMPFATCAKTASSISWVVKKSLARGRAYCAHSLTTAWISSSERGWKAASSLTEPAPL
eukprot:CAMPEP_0179122130 /NCGR_PEP_ID=MMETSP0796-20121207/57629_1 /TAXON_ID=73915 /ORGANISM="Pyrodinium bahamense, Strain pbaha01" /LENGTH=63 /DNA_ID=CAMNT_0020820747 /DNA_START=308 /DNA_END=499 /DNA_ORIENTATION=-